MVQEVKKEQHVFVRAIKDTVPVLSGYIVLGIGFGVLLTALFVTVVAEQWLNTKDHFAAILGFASTVFCLVVFCLLVFGKTLFLIPSMAVIAVGLLIKRQMDEKP